jgi:phosphotriesterase-related protein
MASGVINSVRGEVTAESMRWIHPHEHLLISAREFRGESIANYPGNMEYARRQLVAMLTDLRRYGVTGLVDTTPIGIGRDEAYVEFARAVSHAAEMDVFLATGLYGKAHWPVWAAEQTWQQIADRFTKELENGIGRTGVRPAFLKAAVDEDFGAEEEKVLSAGAMAQQRTGVSLHVHSLAHRREIVELLTGHGVDPTRIYLAHADMNTTEAEWLWLAAQGVRLVTTNWDFPYHMDQAEAYRLVKRLIAAGHLDKILVSLDFSLTIESRWCVGLWTWDNPERTSYAYLHSGVLPKLRAAGITDAQIETIMHDNPLDMLIRR